MHLFGVGKNYLIFLKYIYYAYLGCIFLYSEYSKNSNTVKLQFRFFE